MKGFLEALSEQCMFYAMFLHQTLSVKRFSLNDVCLVCARMLLDSNVRSRWDVKLSECYILQ